MKYLLIFTIILFSCSTESVEPENQMEKVVLNGKWVNENYPIVFEFNRETALIESSDFNYSGEYEFSHEDSEGSKVFYLGSEYKFKIDDEFAEITYVYLYELNCEILHCMEPFFKVNKE